MLLQASGLLNALTFMIETVLKEFTRDLKGLGHAILVMIFV